MIEFLATDRVMICFASRADDSNAVSGREAFASRASLQQVRPHRRQLPGVVPVGLLIERFRNADVLTAVAGQGTIEIADLAAAGVRQQQIERERQENALVEPALAKLLRGYVRLGG